MTSPSPFCPPPSASRLGKLTTAREEEQIPGEEAGGTLVGLPIQQVDQMALCVARSGQSPDLEPSHANYILMTQGTEKQGNSGEKVLVLGMC